MAPFFNWTSFASYDGVDGASTELNVELIFRPDSDNGLVLYQGGRQRGTVEDFFSIGLVDGFVEFRFDNGDGTAILSSKQIELRVDHKIVARRSGRSGSLQLDEGTDIVLGDTGGNETHQRLAGDLYVGGVQDYHVVPKRSGQTMGFVGCVKKLIVQNAEIDLTKPKLTANVYQCDACGGKEPCVNGGVCEEVSPGVKYCDCIFAEFYGDLCQKGELLGTFQLWRMKNCICFSCGICETKFHRKWLYQVPS